MTKKARIAALIETIYQDGMYTEQGRDATRELATLGRPALEALVDAPERPTKQHPRDLMESIINAYCEFAKHIPDVLVGFLEAGRIQPWMVYSALGYAQGERSRQALLIGLQDSYPIVREQALQALIQRREESSVPAIIEALRDRSSSVKSMVVFAMSERAMFRRPEALPLLERIVSSKSMQRHSPGTVEAAKRVIASIRKKSGK
ncbi:MAG TPA: HEAT repeat domain-containing protein [Planctomycetaceae bacterium]|nr:HEAT repeat domain-containing protein [Planctomycetaceae bacterium]